MRRKVLSEHSAVNLSSSDGGIYFGPVNMGCMTEAGLQIFNGTSSTLRVEVRGANDINGPWSLLYFDRIAGSTNSDITTSESVMAFFYDWGLLGCKFISIYASSTDSLGDHSLSKFWILGIV